VLPDHLFVSPDAPRKRYLATRTKAKNYDSNNTLVESEDENAQLKARATTEDPPSGFALDQWYTRHKNGRPNNTTVAHSTHTVKIRGPVDQRRRIRCCGKQRLKEGGDFPLSSDSTTAGHPGITKTLALMKPYYWWPNMKNFVTEYWTLEQEPGGTNNLLVRTAASLHQSFLWLHSIRRLSLVYFQVSSASLVPL